MVLKIIEPVEMGTEMILLDPSNPVSVYVLMFYSSLEVKNDF